MLLAWTAAYVVIITAALIILLVSLRLAIVFFSSGRVRLIWDVIFAIIGLTLIVLIFGF